MPACRFASKATIAFGEEFLYELKAGPAGGRLRRPSSAGKRQQKIAYLPLVPAAIA